MARQIVTIEDPSKLEGSMANEYWEMKNQYFGGINDYRKYGLIQLLTDDRAKLT